MVLKQKTLDRWPRLSLQPCCPRLHLLPQAPDTHTQAPTLWSSRPCPGCSQLPTLQIPSCGLLILQNRNHSGKPSWKEGRREGSHPPVWVRRPCTPLDHGVLTQNYNLLRKCRLPALSPGTACGDGEGLFSHCPIWWPPATCGF